jgi:sugar phosphate isomerase/epimerase
MDLQTMLGVQSWCFREFPSTDALLDQLKQLALPRVELCDLHLPLNDESAWPAFLEKFRAANIQISSIGVQTFKNDEQTEDRWCRFAKAAGASMIAAHFDLAAVPDAYRTAEKLADKHDLLIALHNHGGYHWTGNAMMLQHIFRNTSERIGLCLDTAWCLQAGENPLQWAKGFGKRLYGVHLKDFRFSPHGQWEDVVLDDGALHLGQFLDIALAAPRLTTLTLEYEGDPKNPLPKLRECIKRIRP